MKKILGIFLIIFLTLFLFGCGGEATRITFTDGESITVKVGEIFEPIIKVSPREGEYTLTVQNGTIAEVQGRKIKALKEGVTKIIASSKKTVSECTLYVVEEDNFDPTDPIITKKHTVSFHIVNYKAYDLTTGDLEPMYVLDGARISFTFAPPNGFYFDKWYLDEELTVEYVEDSKIYESMTLYTRVIEKEQGFIIAESNGLVLINGILYPDLPHADIVLPERTEWGSAIDGIADNAFFADTTIKTVTIPSTYLTIGSSTFAGCSNLEKVVFTEGEGSLRNIGNNAFGVKYSDTDSTKVELSCEKLTSVNLPDSVETIGAFAFYRASALVMDGIPNSLVTVATYSFSGTQINNIDFSNVSIVREGAFLDCLSLATVTGTDGITVCEKYAFDNTALEVNARTQYGKDQKEPGYYADTVLFGMYDRYGTYFGDGKYEVKRGTTLIADEALNGSNLTELSLYIEDLAVGSYDVLGKNLFYKDGEYSIGIFVVVGENNLASYKAKYPDYADLFCIKEEVTVVGEDNADEVNWGTHVLLYRGAEYYYDKYIPTENGSANKLKIGVLPRTRGGDIVRINMNAITNVKTSIIDLVGVRKLAYLSIANCSELVKIDLTSNGGLNVTTLENAKSLNLNANCYVYVNDSDYSSYYNKWHAVSPTLAGKLIV